VIKITLDPIVKKNLKFIELNLGVYISDIAGGAFSVHHWTNQNIPFLFTEDGRLIHFGLRSTYNGREETFGGTFDLHFPPMEPLGSQPKLRVLRPKSQEEEIVQVSFERSLLKARLKIKLTRKLFNELKGH
jgi:hypothetical protein